MGSPSPSSPVTQTTQISQMDPRLYQWLYGTANSPGRLQIANASMLGKTMQGVQNADPTALAAWYNVPKGTDLAQFQSHTGAINPGQADPSLMQFPGKSVTPQDYYKQATAGEKEEKKSPTSTAIAAEGGKLVGYAKGGKPKEQLAQPTADLNEYGLTAQQQKKFDTYENMRNSGKKFTQQQIRDYNSMRDTRTQYAQANPNAAKSKTDLSLRDAQVGVTPFYDPETKQSTNPYYNQAVEVLKGMGQTPSQYQQSSDAYSNLQRMANYAPQQVTAQDATAASMGAASMGRGDVRDISAQRARVERMRGGPNVRAVQAQANQMARPEDVAGQTYQAANIAPTQREQAQQIGDIGSITGQGYSAAQMGPVAREAGVTTAAPKTWTDPGVAQQYMNPYMQNVTDIAKRESMRDYGKQLSALNAQAAKFNAYGGSRQAIERSEASRAQGYKLADIENQGLSQAYQQGMGQFQAEQGLGSQVGMSNTAQINQLKSQYMQMGMTEAQANQAAINQAAQFSASQGQSAQTQNVANQLAMQQSNAQMVNQLKSQYMSMGLSEAQANQAAQNQAAQYSAGNLQQAALANQQAGLTTGQANLSAAQQTALANQQAGMTAQQLNQLYGQGGFQANAANQAAQNQAYNNYVAQMLAAQQSNQGMDFNVGQLNTANQQQANLNNAQFQQQTALANQQAQLQAATQNQQAGLSANQQNLGAMGQAGQGFLGVGQGIGAYNQNLLQNWGAAGNTLQNLAQGYYDKRQQSAQNIWGGVNTATQPATGTLLGSPWGTSYQGQYQQRKKGGKLSIKV